MAIVDRMLAVVGLARKEETPIIRTRPSIAVVGAGGVSSARGGSFGWSAGTDYAATSVHGYAQNADAYACISLIAAAAKQVRWWDGSGRSKTSGDVLAKFIEGPQARKIREQLGTKLRLNPIPSLALLNQSGGPAFVEQWVSYMLLAGDAFIEIERNQRAKPAALFLDRPDRVRANPPGTDIPIGSRPGRVDAWKVALFGGGARTIPAADMCHSKLFNPLDDIYGLAPMTAAMFQIAMQNKGANLMAEMLEQGFSPGWIEAHSDKNNGGGWDENQVAAMRARIDESRKRHQEVILVDSAWHSMNEAGGAQLDDSIIRSHEMTRRDIAAVFHVDPALIGDTTARTYATYRESRFALYMEAVIPLLTLFRDDWNRTIGAELQSPLDFDRDSFDAITAARAEAAERVTRLFTNGLITQPEARADLEYETPLATDKFFASATLTPLDVNGDLVAPDGGE